MADVEKIEALVLTALATDAAAKVTTMDVAVANSFKHQDVVGACKSLENDGYVVSTMKTVQQWKLTEEALTICAKGSPEAHLWEMLAEGEVEQTAVQVKLTAPVAAVALANGMKAKLFKTRKEAKHVDPVASATPEAAEEDKKKKKKDNDLVFISRVDPAAKFVDTARNNLIALRDGTKIDPKDADALKKRKLAALEQIKSFELARGPNFAPTRSAKLAADLTRQMLADGSWKETTFKKLNFKAEGREPAGGQLHPLLKVRQEFREIFLEMGFQEMDTQCWVENSFWNFDTLFVPQKHPARDAQDTFFVSKPETGLPLDEDYVKLTKDIHEKGYLCDWSRTETERNVLRTHTTAVSSRVLQQLAQSSPIGPDGKRDFKPGRYFSIDRVFRNEEMDKTHLCEFHQVEGFIVDRNLSLANMMHTLEAFFKRIGVEQLRFKPAFNPYTEPSMEIFGYHTGLKKWMEVGNSGMFRPEMLQPMGFDEDVTAIAWGLSLERPTMIKYALNNIHDLFGHKVDLKFIKRSMIARY